MSTKTKAQLLVEIDALKKRLSNLQAAEAESQRKNEISQQHMLLESEDKFQILFNNAPDAYYMSDTNGTLIDGNLVAEEITGYKREELIGSSFLRKGLLSVGQLPKAAKLLLRNKAGHSTGPDEFTLKRRDNTKVIVEIRTQPVQIKGEKIILGIARDVTKRILVERALKESEEKYQKTFIASPYSMTITNVNTGKFVDVNDGFVRDTGYTLQEVIGKTSSEINLFRNPEDRQRMYEILAEKGCVRDFEIFSRHKNGSDVISLISTDLIKLNGVPHLVTTGNNITDSKKAKRELDESNLRYRSVFESAYDGFLIMRGEKYIDCNENALKIYQRDREFVIGKHPYDPHFSPEYQPDGQQSKPKSKELISLAYQDIPQEFEWVHLRSDGSSYFAEIRLNSVEISGEKLLFVAHRDITERKRVEKALRDGEEKYRSVVEDSPGLISRFLPDGTITFVNKEYCKFFRKDPGELIGTNILSTIPKENREDVRLNIASLSAELPINIYENKNIKDNKYFRWMRWTNRALFDNDGKITNIQSFGEDITERKASQAELIKNEIRYSNLFESAQDGLVIVNIDGIIKAANSAACDMYGYPHEEFIGLSAKKLVHPDFPQEIESFIQTTGNEGSYISNTVDIRKDGSTFYTEVHGSSYTFDDEQLFLAVIRDITEQKQSQDLLLMEKEKAQKYLDIAEVIMLALNKEGEITLINQKGNQVLGYEKDELIGRNWFETCVPERIRKERRHFFRKLIAGETELIEFYENLILTKSGEEKIIAWHSTIVRDEKGHNIGTLSSGEDITERKRAENLLNALNQASVAMGAAQTHKEIFDAISEELKQLDISCMLFPLDETQGMLFTEYLSYESKALKTVEKLVGKKHEGFSFPIDTVDIYREVVREKKILFKENSEQILRQILPKLAKKPATQIIQLLRVQKIISAPLIIEDRVIGLFSIQSDTLTRKDIPAATAFADQLSSAWNKIGLLQNLRKTVEGTIHTIAATVEARDPYTAGHQTRVADLSAAIASEIGLASDQVEGIKMAGVIHDLGKVQVPAEILSKPGKLSELEFDMIKTHSQVGFDLLKNIEFPWPIAQMVLQHHEVMNGSGYPQGLKGDEILLEARILAVADIVEAMSSHRPYRPALGIEKALDQIIKEKGTLLDPDVVEACLKVFEQGYKLPVD